jgi:hypothetical protein
MSPRRKPPRRTGPAAAQTDWDDDGGAGLAGRVHGYDRMEPGPDGDEWAVRAVTGSAAAKPYRCPGCDQEIRSGLPHVVAWPAERFGMGIDERRHWHTPCWSARSRRR